jgi:predicted lactoylglutathione lyase
VSGARVDHLNVVVPDVDVVARFLAALGVAMEPAEGDWAAHHQNIPPGSPFTLDLDSSAFAAHWGGLPSGFSGVVVTVRVDERPEVDELHERALSLGARSLKAPHDAFWGSRYALVEGPGAYVGLMSQRDDAFRSEGPDFSSLR